MSPAKRYQLRTLNSLYQIEENEDGSGTWTRVGTTEASGKIRSDSAIFNYHSPIGLGLSAQFVGEAFDPGKREDHARFLITSPVIQIIPGAEVTDGEVNSSM